MKKLIFALPLFALAACEGSIANEVREMARDGGSMSDGEAVTTSEQDPGEFTKVSSVGPDNIVFTKGDDFSIRAEGDDETIERLRFKLSDGNLKIGRLKDRGWSGRNNAATIYVSAPSLEAIALAGSGDFKADKMSGDNAKISIAGAGDVAVDKLKTDSLKGAIAGSGNLKLAGKAKAVKISIAGSGDISGKKLKVETAKIAIAGSGNVTLSSDGTVDAKVMGSGDIRVHGDAKCTTKAMGSGTVKCG